MGNTDIGLNYAAALMDSLKSEPDVSRAALELQTFNDLLKQLPSLERVLDHPGMALERRKKIMDEVLAKIDPMPISRRFLGIILEKGRISEMGAIVSAFASLKDARFNTAAAEVISATPLDPQMRAEWETALARLTGKKVNITYRTDASIIGGAVTRVGSTVYDGSVRKQLERIRGVLLNN